MDCDFGCTTLNILKAIELETIFLIDREVDLLISFVKRLHGKWGAR